jgi:hypothetical protein
VKTNNILVKTILQINLLINKNITLAHYKKKQRTTNLINKTKIKLLNRLKINNKKLIKIINLNQMFHQKLVNQINHQSNKKLNKS